MSKSNSAAPVEIASPVESKAAAVEELVLQEFCRRLSEKVRRPELISAFEYTEIRAGHLKDTAEAYQARFDSFVKSPV